MKPTSNNPVKSSLNPINVYPCYILFRSPLNQKKKTPLHRWRLTARMPPWELFRRRFCVVFGAWHGPHGPMENGYPWFMDGLFHGKSDIFHFMIWGYWASPIFRHHQKSNDSPSVSEKWSCSGKPNKRVCHGPQSSETCWWSLGC